MNHDGSKDRSKFPAWYHIYVPYKIGQANLGIIIPLLILALGGSGKDIGLATMLFSLVSMITAVGWGKLSDSREIRKPFIVIGFIGLFLCFMMLSLATSYYQIIIIYSMSALLTAAEPPITTVYLLRSSRKNEWDEALGRFNELCGWAWVAGLGIGALLMIYLDIFEISMVLGILVSISVFLAIKKMRDVPVYIKRPHIGIFFTQVVEKRRFVPNFMLHLPDFMKIKNKNNRNFFVSIFFLCVGS
ncbi:MAG: MFS transporter, partial [Candidatus Methanofastidiosia archaeon]